MSEFNITHHPIEMISGTDNTTTTIYRESYQQFNEASKVISPMQQKFLAKLTKDITDVLPKVNSDSKDIAASRGDVNKYAPYEISMECIKMLNSIGINTKDVVALKGIGTALVKLKSFYTEAYSKNVELAKLEYETAVYLLIDGISFVLSNDIDMSTDTNGRIVVKPKKRIFQPKNVISKTIQDMNKELSSSKHESYLSELVKLDINNIEKAISNNGEVESMTEAVNIAVLGKVYNVIVQAIKILPNAFKNFKQIFNIMPIIRSIVYLHYYNKGLKIRKLEQQAMFVQLNIEKLKNKTNISDEEKAKIIKRQQNVIAAYQKKCEKIRAELMEAEKDAATEINQNNSDISTMDVDDLELA